MYPLSVHLTLYLCISTWYPPCWVWTQLTPLWTCGYQLSLSCIVIPYPDATCYCRYHQYINWNCLSIPVTPYAYITFTYIWLLPRGIHLQFISETFYLLIPVPSSMDKTRPCLSQLPQSHQTSISCPCYWNLFLLNLFHGICHHQYDYFYCHQPNTAYKFTHYIPWLCHQTFISYHFQCLFEAGRLLRTSGYYWYNSIKQHPYAPDTSSNIKCPTILHAPLVPINVINLTYVSPSSPSATLCPMPVISHLHKVAMVEPPSLLFLGLVYCTFSFQKRPHRIHPWITSKKTHWWLLPLSFNFFPSITIATISPSFPLYWSGY